jgi:hypothetical protein
LSTNTRSRPNLRPAWAAKPLALTRHEGRTILVLADPGGEPLDRILDRDRQEALDVPRFGCLTVFGETEENDSSQRDTYLAGNFP